MKHFLFCLTAVVLLTACNNNKTEDKVAGASVKESTPAADKPEAASLSCSSFLWFKEGTTLGYNLSDAEGKVTGTTTTHVNKVHTDGGATVADITIGYTKGKELNASYRCEGDRLYMDMKSFFDNNFAAMKRSGIEMEMGDAYITFPWNMKTGDKLDEANFVIKAKKDGKPFMTMTSTVKDRKVEGVEKITTPAGSWDCVKLTETRTTGSEMMGRKIMNLETKSTEWFTPGAGIVKIEMYDANGKLQNRSELVSIK